MKNLLLILALLPLSQAGAHPGIGLVADREGTIFYTDLVNVWRIAPDGQSSIAVPNVHTHELYLDREGCLYGEHLWYEGEATDQWGHYVWRLHPDGTLDTLIGPKEGFREAYSFARDSSETMYWSDSGKVLAIRPDGSIHTLASGFQNVSWLYATPGGTLYLVDLLDLKRISTQGTVTTLATDLAERRRPELSWVNDPHRLMGLWVDDKGTVYVCDYGAGEVHRVTPEGRSTVVTRSPPGWSPSASAITPDGRLWLLEWSADNRARVRSFN